MTHSVPQVLYTSKDKKWVIYRIDQQDSVFEFQASFLGETKLAPQLETIGITETHIRLPMSEILSNISITKGPDFFTKTFGKSDGENFTVRGNLMEKLFAYNLLRPKQLSEEFGTEKFENLLHNIKEKNWNLTAFDKLYGPKSTEFMFKHCIHVHHGDFPQDFPLITPDHHLYPKRPQDFQEMPVIQLQRNANTGHKSLDSFDVMFFISIETHILKSVFKYETNPTLLQILS